MAEISINTVEDLHAFLGTLLESSWTGSFQMSTPSEGERAFVLDLENGGERLAIQVGGSPKSPFVGAPATIVPVDDGSSYLQYTQSQWAAVQAVLGNQ